MDTDANEAGNVQRYIVQFRQAEEQLHNFVNEYISNSMVNPLDTVTLHMYMAAEKVRKNDNFNVMLFQQPSEFCKTIYIYLSVMTTLLVDAMNKHCSLLKSSVIDCCHGIWINFQYCLVLNAKTLFSQQTVNLNEEDSRFVASEHWLQLIMSTFNELIDNAVIPIRIPDNAYWCSFLLNIFRGPASYRLKTRSLDLARLIGRLCLKGFHNKPGENGMQLFSFQCELISRHLGSLLSEFGIERSLIVSLLEPFAPPLPIQGKWSEHEEVGREVPEEEYITTRFNSLISPRAVAALGASISEVHRWMNLKVLDSVTETAAAVLSSDDNSGNSSHIEELETNLMRLAHFSRLFLDPTTKKFGFTQDDIIQYPRPNHVIDIIANESAIPESKIRYLLYILSASYLCTDDPSKATYLHESSLQGVVRMASSKLCNNILDVSISAESSTSRRYSNTQGGKHVYNTERKEDITILQFLQSFINDLQILERIDHPLKTRLFLKLRYAMANLKDDFQTLLALIQNNPVSFFGILAHPSYPSHSNVEVVMCYWIQHQLQHVSKETMRNSKKLKNSVERVLCHNGVISYGIRQLSYSLFESGTDAQPMEVYNNIHLDYDKIRSALLIVLTRYFESPNGTDKILRLDWCRKMCISILRNTIAIKTWLNSSPYACAYFQDFINTIPSKFIATAFSEADTRRKLVIFATNLIKFEISNTYGEANTELLNRCCCKIRILTTIIHTRRDLCHSISSLKNDILGPMQIISEGDSEDVDHVSEKFEANAFTPFLVLFVALYDLSTGLAIANPRLFDFSELQKLTEFYRRVFYVHSKSLRCQVSSISFCCLFISLRRLWWEKCRSMEGKELALSIFNTLLDALRDGKLVNSEATVICLTITLLHQSYQAYRQLPAETEMLKLIQQNPLLSELGHQALCALLYSTDTHSLSKIRLVNLYLTFSKINGETEKITREIHTYMSTYDGTQLSRLSRHLADKEFVISSSDVILFLQFMLNHIEHDRIKNSEAGTSQAINDLFDYCKHQGFRYWCNNCRLGQGKAFSLLTLWHSPYLRMLFPKEWYLLGTGIEG